MLDLLLKAGAEVNRADSQGITPLILAAQNPNTDLISPLLQAGADPEARDHSGRNAKDHAEVAGREWNPKKIGHQR
jgi:ankyrin repeat protein